MGSILSGIALSSILNQNTPREITTQALILIEIMNSVRNYRNTQINPELNTQSEDKFYLKTIIFNN
ncbi:MAG: DUF3365 domain-containing protein [Cyanobacteria bacterium]|nr:DUF3365 domain-containing protein [Cyanobacteria bacterium CG_2015-22_32_23]NCQ40878.1 DUF3365 domain-containing protein [Cyanobacteria bacterium CG_2015-04_32_10]